MLPGHITLMRKREIICTYKILVGKLEGKRAFERPRCKWEDNIGVDLREIGWESVDWIHLAQDRNQWQPGTIKGRKFRNCE
jgi:hypothetical protein